MLARALRNKNNCSGVPRIRCKNGVLTSHPKEIGKVFSDFYGALYNLPLLTTYESPLSRLRDIQEYISKTALPVLTMEARQELDLPFSSKEIADGIASLKIGKSPGPDGYTARFYKQLKEILLPTLTKTFNAISDKVQFSPQSLLAHVVMIPKQDKDPVICGNYRPISLTNIDIRLYSKLLSNRLSPYIFDLVHPDQVGFTPGREARDNTIRTTVRSINIGTSTQF